LGSSTLAKKGNGERGRGEERRGEERGRKV
jgi:hypothetical protein